MRSVTVALVVAVVLALAGCTGGGLPVPAPGGVDPLTAQLLARYGLAASGPTTPQRITIGQDGPPWHLYLEASRRIGLDFSDREGASAELRTTQVAGSNLADRIHVLVHDGTAVGAWLSSESSAPGIYSLTGEP